MLNIQTASMTYYLYHIPGVKIGVTSDPTTRIEKMQGYSKFDYEIIETSKDIEYISMREMELQTKYNYRVETKPYNKLFKSMQINCTNNTSTFQCGKSKLGAYLQKQVPIKWTLPNGTEMELTEADIPWVKENASKSQFRKNECYIYNEAFIKHKMIGDTAVEIFDKIRQWADERGIYEKGDPKTQLIKLFEEAGELSRGVLKKDKELTVDSIGDCVVVLTNLAHLCGYSIEYCVHQAYEEIANRKGKMVNGTFVKQTL